MTLPANDALTLGLTGNHNHDSQSSYSRLSSLRATSPKSKIPFVNSKQATRQTPTSPTAPKSTRTTRSTSTANSASNTVNTSIQGLKTAIPAPVDSDNNTRSYNLRPRKRPASGRSMSNGSVDGATTTSAVPNGHSNGHLTRVNGNAKINGDTKDVALTKGERDSRRLEKAPAKTKAPVDWEIPRKTLHSSIGASRVFDVILSPF